MNTQSPEAPETMHETLLRDFAVVLITAAIVTLLFRKLRQPAVLGYLLAGMFIGPNTPPASFIHDEHTIHTLGEFGVVMLMFSLGLHFSIRRLFEVGASAVIASTLEIILMMGLGFGIGRAFGWSNMDSLFLGALLSISSTTIIIKAIQELNKLGERFVGITFGILIVEDLAAVAMLALLSGVAITGQASLGGLTETLMNLTFFITVVLVLGFIGVPRLFNYIQRFRSDEMLVIAALALCFGVSSLAQYLGFSVALGAFAMGAIIAETRQGAQVEELSAPIRDLFSAVFFVTIGMLVNFEALHEHWLPITLLTLTVIGGKLLSGALGTMLAGHTLRTGLQVGFSLAQIGEFSFIIAAVGFENGATSDFLYPIAIAVSAITTFTTPYLIRRADRVADLLGSPPESAELDAAAIAKVAPSHLSPMQMVLRRELRRALVQILLNIVLIGALFASANALMDTFPSLDRYIPQQLGGANAVLWATVVLVAMPMLVAVFRKLQAVSMMLGETAVSNDLPTEQKYALRQRISNALLTVFCLFFGAAFLLMGASLLPPWPVLVILLLVLLALVYSLWGHFVAVYSRAQIALRETLSDTPAPHVAPKVLTHLLAGAHVEQATIPVRGAAAGKMIRELEIRQRSGASVIAIERTEGPVLNPTPYEELAAGDIVYLFGTDAQCAKALALLTAQD
jgi:CPA2 family monovalent cation:H+ antiporter-2